MTANGSQYQCRMCRPISRCRQRKTVPKLPLPSSSPSRGRRCSQSCAPHFVLLCLYSWPVHDRAVPMENLHRGHAWHPRMAARPSSVSTALVDVVKALAADGHWRGGGAAGLPTASAAARGGGGRRAPRRLPLSILLPLAPAWLQLWPARGRRSHPQAPGILDS